MATIIGVISSAITIFSFLQSEFPKSPPPSASLRFSIALNNNNKGGESLTGAGGTKPDIRLWADNFVSLATKVNDNNKCVDGSVVCDSKVRNVKRQPTYTLLTGNNDAICLAWTSITFPGGTQLGHTTGNWAEECSEHHGVDTTWYYSGQYLHHDGGGGSYVSCGWLDRDGNQPTTGIQIHWPSFDRTANNPASTANYCGNLNVMAFHTDHDPNYVYEKRSAGDENYNRLSKRFAEDSTLVKSLIPQHTASKLCNARRSVGPSFVSYEERQFCFMPLKTAYPFCEDIDSGACWDDDLHIVVPKSVSALDIPLLDIPSMFFNNTILWDPKEL